MRSGIGCAMIFLSVDGVRIEIAPHVQFYEEQRRHGNSLSIEDGCHHFAAAPFNFRFYGYRSVCLTFTKRTCLLIV